MQFSVSKIRFNKKPKIKKNKNTDSYTEAKQLGSYILRSKETTVITGLLPPRVRFIHRNKGASQAEQAPNVPDCLHETFMPQRIHEEEQSKDQEDPSPHYLHHPIGRQIFLAFCLFDWVLAFGAYIQ